MSCRLTNFALNTNTDCFGRRMHVAIPYVPAEYAATYLLYFSRSCRQAPPVLTHSTPPPPPPPHLPGSNMAVLSLCLEADRCKAVGSNNMCGESPLGHPHLASSALPPWGVCHSGPDRWWGGKERAKLCTSHSVVCAISVGWGECGR